MLLQTLHCLKHGFESGEPGCIDGALDGAFVGHFVVEGPGILLRDCRTDAGGGSIGGKYLLMMSRISVPQRSMCCQLN
jgi:hypothetical protein